MSSIFDDTRVLAWEYLRRHEVCGVPNLRKLCENDGFVLLPYSDRFSKKIAKMTNSEKSIEEYTGFCFFVEDIPVIFYNDSHSPKSQDFTIAHEIGHIIRGDLGTPVLKKCSVKERRKDLLKALNRRFYEDIIPPSSRQYTRVTSDFLEAAADFFAVWILAGSDLIDV